MKRSLMLFILMLNTVFCLFSTTEHRPWGYYTILADSPTYKIKKLVVYSHKRLSLQRHKFRSEHWTILQGQGLVTLNKEQIKVAKDSTVHIKPLDIHRIENIGENALEFIEVQTGTYFGEDDIERLEDDFGRVQ